MNCFDSMGIRPVFACSKAQLIFVWRPISLEVAGDIGHRSCMATNFDKRARMKIISSCSAAMDWPATYMFMFHFSSYHARCSWCIDSTFACTRPAGSQFVKLGLDVPQWKLPALDAMIMSDCLHLFILAS